MTARPILTVLLGALLGGAAVTLNPLHSAPAPEPRPQRWEYKVVDCNTQSVRRAGATPADELTEQFNILAKEGWEYTGPVASHGRGGDLHGGYVAFRRAAPLPPPPPPRP